MNHPPAAAPDAQSNRARLFAGSALCAAVAAAYLLTLHPGLWHGDSAEAQYMSTLLGVSHMPGYSLYLMCGKLCTLLPVGATPAWRINLMSAVFGVLGVALLYASVLRITGGILPGVLSGATLAFSSIYWDKANVAEVYTFYTATLLAVVYALVRWIESDSSLWLNTCAAALGACIGDRPAELFVLPGLVACWWCFRRRVTLPWRRLATAALVALAPLVISVAYFVVRYDSRNLALRDDLLRDRIVLGQKPFEELSWREKLVETVRYRLALKWTKVGYTKYSPERFWNDVDKYAWAIGGLGAFGDRYAADDVRNVFQGRGASVGAPGVLLALAGAWRWRRRPGWVLLSLGMLAGNVAFFLWHHPLDNLTFVIPSLIGLSLLMGLGVAAPGDDAAKRDHDRRAQPAAALARGAWRSWGFGAACLMIPALLLATNYRFMNRRTGLEREWMERVASLRTTPFPPNSAMLLTARLNWTASFYYLFHIDAQRPDVHVIRFPSATDTAARARLAAYFQERGRPVFHWRDDLPPSRAAELAARTPAEIADRGFVALRP
jgi:hypothetical protein